MLKTLFRRAPVVLRAQQQVLPMTVTPILKNTQTRSYAAGKKKDKDDEDENGFSFIPNRFVNAMPKDQMAPATVKKVSLTLCQNNSWLLRNEKVDQVMFESEADGTVCILPNYETSWFKVKPGLLTLTYNEDRVEKWITAGGTAHIFYFGPMQINSIEAYKLEELDINLVRREIEQQKELLKSRSDKTKGQAQIALDLYEPILAELEKSEFA